MRKQRLIFVWALSACAASHGARERAQESRVEAGVYFEGDGPFAPVQEPELSAALAEALVQESVRCCGELGLVFDMVPERTAAFERAFASPDPASGARFQPAAAAACLASMRPSECRRSKENALADNPCQEMYVHGTRRPGEPCQSHWDCANDRPDTVARCESQSPSSSVCALGRVLHEGDACTNSGISAPCDTNLLCDPERGACVARAKLGEPCVTGPNFGDTCAAGAVCDRQGSKRCVRPRAAGQPCSAPEQCEDLACVDGVCREPLAARMTCGVARTGPLRR